ncbi:MAG: polyprenyl synthetase family protein [Pirellulaceae bacterium]|nr:polyprenyl synthetase family protein [Pirellulaceae bacterium]
MSQLKTDSSQQAIALFQIERDRWQPLVDERLERYAQYDNGCPAKLRDAIRHSLLAPAKRLRPILTLLSAEMCGGDPLEALPVACAVEMIHTYSLIHDDLPSMDDDDLRRGLPSCHAQFGEATAILAGDALLAQAFEVVARDVQPASLAVTCCREMAVAAGASQLVGGQEDDLASEGREDLTAEDLAKIHDRKTGAMIRVSLRLGARIAGANEEQLKNLDIFGEKIGLTFQIVDDLLDYCGEQAKMGKSVGKDSKSSKLTYVKIHGLDPSREIASDLIQKSIGALEGFGSDAAPLVGLAHFILNRTN